MSLGFRWTLRVLVWSVALVALLPLYRASVSFGSLATLEKCAVEFKGTHGGRLFQAQRFSLCMFLNSSFLESRRLEPTVRDVMAIRDAPCERVGIWKSARRHSVYRVTLQDDNRFSAEPVADFGPPGSSSLTGSWGEVNGRLIWIYDEGVVWPPDVNRIEAQAVDKFTLVEVNGERTEFTRERMPESGRCSSA